MYRRGRERWNAFVRGVRGRHKQSEHAFVCVCVCVCVRERERERYESFINSADDDNRKISLRS